jgi:two-component system LytT family response regulator
MNATVLIADDEPLARRTLTEHLRSMGCTGPIREAGDGKTAIAMANSQRPDLIFSTSSCRARRGCRSWSNLSTSRSIFTTAYDQHAVTAFELGALDYVLKPFGRERLARVMQRAQAALDGSGANSG